MEYAVSSIIQVMVMATSADVVLIVGQLFTNHDLDWWLSLSWRGKDGNPASRGRLQSLHPHATLVETSASASHAKFFFASGSTVLF